MKKIGYRRIKDFTDNPLEIFDGVEPKSLLLTPKDCGLDENYRCVDLLDEIKKSRRQDETGQMYQLLYGELSTRVLAFNKSSGKKESVHGYVAIMENQRTYKPIFVLFTFFEVSPSRYHAYVHNIHEKE